MCLNWRIELAEVLDYIKTEEFYAYKVVKKQGDRLVSPYYCYYEWKPGELQAKVTSDDSGFYVFITNSKSFLVAFRLLISVASRL